MFRHFFLSVVARINGRDRFVPTYHPLAAAEQLFPFFVPDRFLKYSRIVIDSRRAMVHADRLQ